MVTLSITSIPVRAGAIVSIGSSAAERSSKKCLFTTLAALLCTIRIPKCELVLKVPSTADPINVKFPVAPSSRNSDQLSDPSRVIFTRKGLLLLLFTISSSLAIKGTFDPASRR